MTPPKITRLTGQPDPDPDHKSSGGGVAAALFTLLVLGAMIAGFWMLKDSKYNPRTPLDPLAELHVATSYQLARTAEDPLLCQAALATLQAQFSTVEDQVDSALCHIRPNVELTSLAAADLTDINTRCATALRLAMWDHHIVQPAALQHFGQGVRRINHFGSYSCRRMRTSSGASTAMSAHATADAIDIAGVTLGDGRSLSLHSGWDLPAQSGFWRDLRDGACRLFPTVLSPDYNALHADHFHFAKGRWGACR